MLDHETACVPEGALGLVSQLGWVDSGKATAPAFASDRGKSESSHVAAASIFVKRCVVLLYANSPASPPTRKKVRVLAARARRSRYVRPFRSGACTA
jgi:hypothetical protein